jgi:hypothetical protein
LDNGRAIERDLTPFLIGRVFENIRRSDQVFRSFRLRGGTIVWPNGADLSPEILIWGGPPPREYLSPSVRETTAPYVTHSRDQNLADRLHRARSWFTASDSVPADRAQEVFVALFIAFNAMYGRRQYEDKTKTMEDLEAFIGKLGDMHEADLATGRATLTNTLFQLRSSIRAIVMNFFLRDSYWRREIRHDVLVRRFEAQYAAAERRLKDGDWKPLLRLVLQRCMVLRNQIFHGCVTHGSVSRGWESVEQGVAVFRPLVKVFTELMERHGHHAKDWEPLPYPRLGSSLHPRQGTLA